MSQLNFEQGLAYAVAELVRIYDEPTMAKAILENSGITIKQLKEAGVVKYDLDIIKKFMKGVENDS